MSERAIRGLKRGDGPIDVAFSRPAAPFPPPLSRGAIYEIPMASGLLPSRFPIQVGVILSGQERRAPMLDVWTVVAVVAAFAAAVAYAYLCERL